MSSMNVKISQHDAIAKHTVGLQQKTEANVAALDPKIAIEYPNGAFQVNGNLQHRMTNLSKIFFNKFSYDCIQIRAYMSGNGK